jgi:hypothetical protein
MRKSRFSESQIVELLKEGDAGVPVADLLRQHGISRAKYCKWKGTYGGASVPDRPPVMDSQRDRPVITALEAVGTTSTRWGFWKCCDRLRLLGHGGNPKRVPRVYCALRLNLPRRTKRRVPTRVRQPLDAPPLTVLPGPTTVPESPYPLGA